MTAPIEVDRPDPRPPIPNPEPVQQREVRWVILTPETIPPGDGWVFFALIPPDYEDLAFNMADLLRWIQGAAWRLDYYRGELPHPETEGDG